MGEMINADKLWSENISEKDNLEDLAADGRITKLILIEILCWGVDLIHSRG
jgi:hypothetical protein